MAVRLLPTSSYIGKHKPTKVTNVTMLDLSLIPEQSVS